MGDSKKKKTWEKESNILLHNDFTKYVNNYNISLLNRVKYNNRYGYTCFINYKNLNARYCFIIRI